MHCSVYKEFSIPITADKKMKRLNCNLLLDTLLHILVDLIMILYLISCIIFCFY